MSSTANAYEELFDGGLPLRVQRSLGLVKPGRLLDATRALFVVLSGWLPLAYLATTPFLIRLTNRHGFFPDYSFHARGGTRDED